MKTQINKSRIMKRAWSIFRGTNPYSGDFSASLRRSWFIEKDDIRYHAELAEIAENERLMAERAAARKSIPSNEFLHQNAICNWYDNAPQGTYFGD